MTPENPEPPKPENAKPEKRKIGAMEDTARTVIFALLFAAILRTLFFQPFWIPSGSMKDTLLVGDFLFVNKMVYGYSRHSCPFSICPISGRIFGSEPKRGEIIVFKSPNRNIDLIKRLVGLPGDTVQMKNGVLHLNNTPAPLNEVAEFVEPFAPQGSLNIIPGCQNRPNYIGAECKKQKFIETLPNGVKHSVLWIRDPALSNTPIFTVPEAHYFFMGDNRDNSLDSRRSAAIGGLGFVPHENLIGRADRVIFSSAGSRILYFWTWRSDRFFKRLF